MTKRTHRGRAARKIQKVSSLGYCEALEWVILHEEKIHTRADKESIRFQDMALTIWKED